MLSKLRTRCSSLWRQVVVSQRIEFLVPPISLILIKNKRQSNITVMKMLNFG